MQWKVMSLSSSPENRDHHANGCFDWLISGYDCKKTQEFIKLTLIYLKFTITPRSGEQYIHVKVNLNISATYFTIYNILIHID